MKKHKIIVDGCAFTLIFIIFIIIDYFRDKTYIPCIIGIIILLWIVTCVIFYFNITDKKDNGGDK